MSAAEHLRAGVRDHRAVVDAEPLVGGKQPRASFPRHHAHHALQALVAPHAPNDEHLLGAAVSHRALRDLDEHREDRLLQTVSFKLVTGISVTFKLQLFFYFSYSYKSVTVTGISVQIKSIFILNIQLIKCSADSSISRCLKIDRQA